MVSPRLILILRELRLLEHVLVRLNLEWLPGSAAVSPYRPHFWCQGGDSLCLWQNSTHTQSEGCLLSFLQPPKLGLFTPSARQRSCLLCVFVLFWIWDMFWKKQISRKQRQNCRSMASCLS